MTVTVVHLTNKLHSQCVTTAHSQPLNVVTCVTQALLFAEWSGQQNRSEIEWGRPKTQKTRTDCVTVQTERGSKKASTSGLLYTIENTSSAVTVQHCLHTALVKAINSVCCGHHSVTGLFMRGVCIG